MQLFVEKLSKTAESDRDRETLSKTAESDRDTETDTETERERTQTLWTLFYKDYSPGSVKSQQPVLAMLLMDNNF